MHIDGLLIKRNRYHDYYNIYGFQMLKLTKSDAHQTEAQMYVQNYQQYPSWKILNLCTSKTILKILPVY